MQKLSLPPFEVHLRKNNGRTEIWDIIRRKYVWLTPEEWVRQHFVHYLIAQKYPKNLISIEKGLYYGQLLKRSDVVVYDREMKPFMLVECKAPNVAIDRQTYAQSAVYQQILQSRYMALTNGMHSIFASRNPEKQSWEWSEELPKFE
jgi:Type I restriction enzyme R protein N terminus (HSDR_N)